MQRLPLQERRKRRRHSMLRTLFVILLLMGGFMFMRSPFFAIVETEVIGVDIIDPVDLVVRSELIASTLIWDVNPRVIAERIRSHPRVAGATVKRIWPNRLLIEVMERQPIAVIKIPTGWMTVDAEGVVLGQVKDNSDKLLQLIYHELLTLAPGQTVPAELQLAVEMAGYIRQFDLPWIEIVDVSSSEIVLGLSGDIPAYLGPSIEQPERRLAVLQSLWTSWQDDLDRVRYFDIENIRHPAVQTVLDTDDA